MKFKYTSTNLIVSKASWIMKFSIRVAVVFLGALAFCVGAEEGGQFSDLPVKLEWFAPVVAAITAVATPIIAWILSSRFQNRELAKIDYLCKQTQLMQQLIDLQQSYKDKGGNALVVDSISNELKERLVATHKQLINRSAIMEIESRRERQIEIEDLARNSRIFLRFRPNTTQGWLLSILFWYFLLAIPGSLAIAIGAEDTMYIVYAAIYGIVVRTIYRKAISVYKNKRRTDNEFIKEVSDLGGKILFVESAS